MLFSFSGGTGGSCSFEYDETPSKKKFLARLDVYMGGNAGNKIILRVLYYYKINQIKCVSVCMCMYVFYVCL